MSTRQCRRLRDAFRRARAADTKVIVLLGGRHYFSNGIHLNTIEAARDPAAESWANINAIDDLVLDILETRSHLVVAALGGNAGAGGAMMALAADRVYARDGVVLNPHYKGMGGLYGSEYWTYTLPRRVGPQTALELTDRLAPMGARHARKVNFVDDVFGDDAHEFEAGVVRRAEDLAHHRDFTTMLAVKGERRRADERRKPLAAYRAEELARMSENFFGPDPAYHEARQRFVRKGAIRPRGGAASSIAQLHHFDSHFDEPVPHHSQTPGCAAGHVDDRALPEVAAVGAAIDHAQGDAAAVLEVGHADHRPQGEGPVRGDQLALVEDFAAGRLLTVESRPVP